MGREFHIIEGSEGYVARKVIPRENLYEAKAAMREKIAVCGLRAIGFRRDGGGSRLPEPLLRMDLGKGAD